MYCSIVSIVTLYYSIVLLHCVYCSIVSIVTLCVLFHCKYCYVVLLHCIITLCVLFHCMNLYVVCIVILCVLFGCQAPESEDVHCADHHDVYQVPGASLHAPPVDPSGNRAEGGHW